MLSENAIYVIQNQKKIREGYLRYKYIILKYWDGLHWIVRFLKNGNTNWIALTETRLVNMIGDGTIRIPDAHERLEAMIMENKLGY